MYFRFSRACVRHYTVRPTMYSYTEFCSIWKGGGELKFLCQEIASFAIFLEIFSTPSIMVTDNDRSTITMFIQISSLWNNTDVYIFRIRLKEWPRAHLLQAHTLHSSLQFVHFKKFSDLISESNRMAASSSSSNRPTKNGIIGSTSGPSPKRARISWFLKPFNSVESLNLH